MIWLNCCPTCNGDLAHYQEKLWYRVTCTRCSRSLNANQVSILYGYTSGVANSRPDVPGYLFGAPVAPHLRNAA